MILQSVRVFSTYVDGKPDSQQLASVVSALIAKGIEDEGKTADDLLYAPTVTMVSHAGWLYLTAVCVVNNGNDS